MDVAAATDRAAEENQFDHNTEDNAEDQEHEEKGPVQWPGTPGTCFGGARRWCCLDRTVFHFLEIREEYAISHKLTGGSEIHVDDVNCWRRGR